MVQLTGKPSIYYNRYYNNYMQYIYVYMIWNCGRHRCVCVCVCVCVCRLMAPTHLRLMFTGHARKRHETYNRDVFTVRRSLLSPAALDVCTTNACMRVCVPVRQASNGIARAHTQTRWKTIDMRAEYDGVQLANWVTFSSHPSL